MATIKVEQRVNIRSNDTTILAFVNQGHTQLNGFFTEVIHHFINKVLQMRGADDQLVVSTCFYGEMIKSGIEELDGLEQNEKRNLFVHPRTTIIDSNTVLGAHFIDTVVSFVKNKIMEIQIGDNSLKFSRIIEMIIRIDNLSSYRLIRPPINHDF